MRAIVLLAVLTVFGVPGMASAADGEFSVHGFLTQAYAASDGHQVLGITRGGTTDYRNLAVQLRYAPSSRSAFAMQLENQRIGNSPATDSNGEVKLNWAFVSHEIGGNSEIKLGKTRLPLGIYNEIRSVGSVLPFYRVPYCIYREATLTSEAVDGVVYSAGFPAGNGWRFTSDLFYGGWDTVELNGSSADPSRVDKATGAQLWLYTPIQSMRFGAEATRAHVTPSSDQSIVRGNLDFMLFSFDGHPGPFITQSEFFRATFSGTTYWAAYGHLGLELTRSLALHGEVDHAHLKIRLASPLGVESADREYLNDYVLGVNYAMGYDVLLKAETHWARGFDIEDNPPDVFTGSPARTRYFILSASASF